MKKVKILIAFTLLFIVVGIAAVTTNLIINVSTPIASNQDDFLVYFSDVKVNGTQDLSLVKSEKELVFSKEFSAVGDKVTIEYDVTNASKNYDATISISCTESNNYLNITNNFDQKSNLLARSTRTGTLTVELTNAVSQETSYEIKCTIIGTAVERETEGSGDVSTPLTRTFNIGEEVSIGNEKFNVIRDNGDSVTMLAQYNLGTNNRQSTTTNYVTFSNSKGWECAPGPKEIDIQQYDGDAKAYVNNYVRYLKGEIGDSTLTGTLITLTELKFLGCIINDDYSDTEDVTCVGSEHMSWLVNGQEWWTRSAIPTEPNWVWHVSDDGSLSLAGYQYIMGIGVRPVITISKSYLLNDMISFTLAGKTYNVPNDTTWASFLASDVNDTSLEPDIDDTIYDFNKCSGHCATVLYNPNNLTFDNFCDVSTAYNNDLIRDVYINDFIIRNGIYIVEDAYTGLFGCPNE